MHVLLRACAAGWRSSRFVDMPLQCGAMRSGALIRLNGFVLPAVKRCPHTIYSIRTSVRSPGLRREPATCRRCACCAVRPPPPRPRSTAINSLPMSGRPERARFWQAPRIRTAATESGGCRVRWVPPSAPAVPADDRQGSARPMRPQAASGRTTGRSAASPRRWPHVHWFHYDVIDHVHTTAGGAAIRYRSVAERYVATLARRHPTWGVDSGLHRSARARGR